MYDKKLIDVFKGLLKNKKFEILHLAYRYNKKPYKNQNWLVKKLLDEWAIKIKEKNYITMRSVQDELLKLDFISLLPFMENIFYLVQQKCLKYIIKSDKYKQIRFAFVQLTKHHKSISKNDLIIWIKEKDLDLYNDIINDKNWNENFFIHINKVHTAFHCFLLDCAKKMNYKSAKLEPITSLYKNLFSSFSGIKEDIVKTDGLLVKILNDLRNNHSKAHPNKIPNIEIKIGQLFLFKIKNLVQEIKLSIEK